jgi:N-acetylneuraminic acid mutarotase
MGKKDKKKDASKKFALQAKKEAKAGKKAQKRLLKENAKELEAKGITATTKTQQQDDDNDIDALLEAYQKQSLDLAAPVIETIFADSESSPNKSAPIFPYPPRSNFTLTLCPTSSDLYMFGGEYFNGAENVIFDELLCWNPDAVVKNDDEKEDSDGDSDNTTQSKIGVWKRIMSPQPRPPARCSHTTVYYNNALYVFGGEFASADNYHHYKDIWKFDIKTNLWTEIKPRNRCGPTSRSGHRSLVWRHYMIIFGGFFEAVRETPRWYNDLHVYDFSTNSWIECKYSALASIPPERSAFNFGMFTGSDVAFVSGGFSKLKNPTPGSKAEGLTFTDCWALHLKNLENGKIPTWEKMSKKGEYPSQRSGTSCTLWKNKMLVFGGVHDEETDNHKVQSVFYDDLFALDMERRRWFKLSLKKKAGDRRRRKKKNDDSEEKIDANVASDRDSDDEDFDNVADGEATSSGWDIDMLRSNMFAFIDAEGNIVYEKIEPEEGEEEENDKKLPANSLPEVAEETEIDGGYEADAGNTTEVQKENGDTGKGKEINAEKVLEEFRAPLPGMTLKPLIAKSEVMALNKEGVPEAVARKCPLPRINAQIVVRGNTLIIYGGILEVGDREVTLDDCWSIDLQKREEWNCVWNGTMHKQVWKGVESDNESYISTDRGTGGMESDDEEEFDEFEENNLDEEAKAAAKAARKEARKAAKKEKMRGVREEIKALNEKLNLDDVNKTPQGEEDLAAFYARTSIYWEQQASEIIPSQSEAGELSIKEMKREGFNLARERYEELKPVLERLNELQGNEKEHDEHKKSKKANKKEKKKKDRRK